MLEKVSFFDKNEFGQLRHCGKIKWETTKNCLIDEIAATRQPLDLFKLGKGFRMRRHRRKKSSQRISVGGVFFRNRVKINYCLHKDRHEDDPKKILKITYSG